MNEEFIAKIIAELFNYPCNFSPCEEELHNTEERIKWCEEHCNKCSAADCWLHYFGIKYKEKSMSGRKLTKREQEVATEILTEFMMAKNMDEMIKVWNDMFEQYNLCKDPFTLCPCTPDEYCKNRLEYDKQTMIEKYGHCDGLE